MKLRKYSLALVLLFFLTLFYPCHADILQEIGPKPAPLKAKWKGLTGKYKSGKEEYLLLEKNSTLFLWEKNSGYTQLREKGKDVFETLPPDKYGMGTLRFVRDKKGEAVLVSWGKVMFQREFFGSEGGKTFKIKPLYPVESLRGDAMKAIPPEENGIFNKPELTEVVKLDPAIKLEIRYATTNNFMGAAFYSEPRAFLQKPAAQAVVRAKEKLAKLGYGILIYDAYRPWYVTKMFWEATPEKQKMFVANPEKGSRHNRGCAVDLTLIDLKTGKPVEMTSGYDEFSERAYSDYVGETSQARWHRELLRKVMESEGFKINPEEWWHFDYDGWQSWKIMNIPFEDIGK
ncbi:MAG: M15 family metallopeptidase [Firmicutes bacterium]|nr:M15 family metallopeptidase [Bacillota bacterium]